MSGLDPLSAIAAQIAATQPAVADAALDLGAIAQVLQAQLSVGDLLEATVLPSKGGQDLISILGQTVVANLPADVHPGDVMLLQVTGFQGNQILVQNLGIQDPANPVPVFVPQLPPQPAGSGQTGATLTTIVGNPNLPATATPASAPPPAVLPARTEPPIAPPTAVFVAASVRPAAAPASPPASAPGTPPASAPGTPPANTPGTPPASTPGTPPASTPGTPPASTPGTPPASTPGTPPASTPGTPPASAPGTPPASTPGIPPTSAPGTPPAGTPGTPPASAPGTSPAAGQQIPGTVAEPRVSSAAPPLPRSIPGEPPAAPVRINLESRIAASRAASAERSTTPAAQAPVDQNKPAPIQPPARTVANVQSARENTPVRAINLPTTPPLISRATIASPEVPPAASPATAEETAEPLPAAQAQAPRIPIATPVISQSATSKNVSIAPAPVISTSAQLATAVASKEPVRILAALHIPATPVTLAAARMITNAATQVASALQHLETALSTAPPSDARVATLQTLTSFLSRLDPRNEQTFPAQLSSFVGNVVEGAESKLAQLLQALVPRTTGATAQASIKAALADVSMPQGGQSAALPAQAAAAHGQSAPALAPQTPILAEARAAERQMALTQDLKTTLLSLLANPPAGASAQLTQALGDTLTALTAMQFNTLVAAQTDPTTLGFSIPVVFYDGGQATTIRVSRDAPKNKQRLDADNFHIAFILDTASLGTVAIDLETIGRSVKVQVKTDRASAVDRFSSTLGDLRSRLEHLRYRITSAGADMVSAPAHQSATAPAALSDVRAGKISNLDLQA